MAMKQISKSGYDKLKEELDYRMNEKQENTIRLKKQGRMGDGRILEWTAGFIDTLSAVCRLPVQGNQTEIAGIHTE